MRGADAGASARSSLVAAAGVAIAVGCQPRPHIGAAASAAPPAVGVVRKAPSETELRQAMFRQLVRDIRAYHLFSDAWPEPAWSAELPRLETAVLAAPDRAALLL